MEACREELRRLRNSTPGIQSLGLAGPDGFEVASLLRGSVDQNKIAALTSTMVAVAHAVTRECGLATTREVILETDSGRVLLMDVPAAEMRYALYVIAADEALLGRTIGQTRACAANLAGILSGAKPSEANG
ncbi:MAG: roadblock/LC7 domain-containing protein [Bryobacterales bacterium]|nr:roadblock/LC7 domain-containing protein [Acidobacteriota bacterium]MCB9384280.1 roadblock/LC7 domain-containing protein [Bryobacterales bacterium]